MIVLFTPPPRRRSLHPAAAAADAVLFTPPPPPPFLPSRRRRRRPASLFFNFGLCTREPPECWQSVVALGLTQRIETKYVTLVLYKSLNRWLQQLQIKVHRGRTLGSCTAIRIG